MKKAKKKSELQIAADLVENLVRKANDKINILGQYTDRLYCALNMLQRQFDTIRNIPSKQLAEYHSAKEISSNWHTQVQAIEKDFKETAICNLGGGVANVGLGVGIAAMGPTAAMGVATTFGVASTGTAISSLSGAVATKAALAWLGGGSLATGGSGIAGGSAFLSMFGPIGWTIAGVALLGSGLLFWKTKSDKKKLESLFLKISKRDEKTYNLAIVELDERTHRIIDETEKLNEGLLRICTFGTNYNQMTEEQQLTLGSYVNLMKASTQLLVAPILGLLPKYSDDNLKEFLTKHSIQNYSIAESSHKKLIVSFANLLYRINTNESERKLLSKSFRGNKDYLQKMDVTKADITPELFETVNRVLQYLYKQKKKD
jgi:hypothetical protein